MAERTRAGEGLWAQKQHQKPKTQSWGLRAAGRDSPEGPTTATSSPSATQAGSRLLTGHLHQAGPMGLHEQTIPGALRRCSQGIARPCGDNTAVISHQQIPNSISRTMFNFAFIYVSKNVGFGGNIPAVTGKDPLQQRFSGSWWGVVSFRSASANTFFFAIKCLLCYFSMGNFERKIWIFLHCHYHREHGTSQTASAEWSGILRSRFQTFSPVTTAISARGRRGDIY